MKTAISVVEAVEWREPAPGGGSDAQVFRLSDGRFVIVKFPENKQGEKVLANEFISCQLAESLSLPVNQSVLVSIDERLLQLPRQNGKVPNNFTAGIRCGMIRFENAEGSQPKDIFDHCTNSLQLHAIAVFEEFVCRQDGRQLLMYSPPGQSSKHFAAYDYGFAFGGQPEWSTATLTGLSAASLPLNDPYTLQPYSDGSLLRATIDQLRNFTPQQLSDCLMELHPPRWGVTISDVETLVSVLKGRADALVTQFDQRYPN